MKLISLFIGVLIASTSLSQTNIIAARSHSGNLSQLEKETANFGLNDYDIIDSVIYIGGDCIIEIRQSWNNNHHRDTICDNYYFKEHGYVLREAKKAYSSSTVLVGFIDDDESMNRVNNWPRQNGVSWFVGFVILSVIAYIFVPAFKRS